MRSAIDRTDSIEELNRLRMKVEAMRVLSSKSRQSLETQNKIAEYRLRIDRKRGAWLRGNIEKRGNGSNQHARRELKSHACTLAEVGITRAESSALQRIARLPEAEFELFIERANETATELTTAGLLRLEAALRFADRGAPPMPRGKYGVVYADPPWAYANDRTRIKSVSEHYPTLTLEAICALGEEVRRRAAKDCALFLWVPSPHLHEFPAVLAAWGFAYRTSWVWHKMAHNFGFYGSTEHEMLVIGGRGRATPTCDPKTVQAISSVQSIKRTTHSSKPAEYYALIERLYPDRRRLELFSRAKEPREGWTYWGDEVGVPSDQEKGARLAR